jgi:predicted transcriptional regulator
MHRDTEVFMTDGRTQISIRVPDAMLEAFSQIGSALDRDRTWVMLQAMQFYIDREGKDILIDAEGIAAVKRGEMVDLDTARRRIDAAIERGRAARSKKAS